MALGAVEVAHDQALTLSDSLRQETAEWMHENHPLWIAQFSMDPRNLPRSKGIMSRLPYGWFLVFFVLVPMSAFLVTR